MPHFKSWIPNLTTNESTIFWENEINLIAPLGTWQNTQIQKQLHQKILSYEPKQNPISFQNENLSTPIETYNFLKIKQQNQI